MFKLYLESPNNNYNIKEIIKLVGICSYFDTDISNLLVQFRKQNVNLLRIYV